MFAFGYPGVPVQPSPGRARAARPVPPEAPDPRAPHFRAFGTRAPARAIARTRAMKTTR